MKNYNRKNDYEPDFGEVEERNVRCLGTVQDMLDDINRTSMKKIWEAVNDYHCSRSW